MVMKWKTQGKLYKEKPIMGETSPKRQCTILREVLQFSIKPLNLDSTNHR